MKQQRLSSASHQRGVVMWVALGVLVLMSLAGLAMLRQMAGGVSIAGNVAFKQSATVAGDWGTELARVWITTPGNVLRSDQPAVGYYSTWGASVDPATFNWGAGSSPPVTDAATGNTITYVIHRLCQQANMDSNAPGQKCSAEGTRPPGRDPDGNVYPTIVSPYFRVTTQVTGPRNTVSYTQVVMN